MGTKKEEIKEDEIEHCVRCGTATKYKKSDNVLFRSGYIEGAGQLCFKCSHQRKLHRQGNYDL